MLPTGRRVAKKLTVPPHSRRTICVDSLPTLRSAEVSTKVFSTNGVPFVVEKAVYFGHNGWDGGHVTLGYSP